LLVFLYSSIISAIGNVVYFMVGTSKFVSVALGFAASLVEEPAQGACQPEMMKKTAMRISLVDSGQSSASVPTLPHP